LGNSIIIGPYRWYASKLFVNDTEIFKIVSLLLGLKRFVVFDINRKALNNGTIYLKVCFAGCHNL